MNRRRAAAVLAATIAAGAGLIVAGVALDEHTRPGLAVDAPLQALVAYAYVGYWAETRGLVTARTWLTRPDRTLRALVARAGQPRGCIRVASYGRANDEITRLMRGDPDPDLAALARDTTTT